MQLLRAAILEPACLNATPAAANRAGAILTIDLTAIAENYRFLQKQAQTAVCAAVVKADAYGLGAQEVAPVLARAGCRQFFVAHLEEGIELRRILGARVTIAILHDPPAARRPNSLLTTLCRFSTVSIRSAVGRTPRGQPTRNFQRSYRPTRAWRGSASAKPTSAPSSMISSDWTPSTCTS